MIKEPLRSQEETPSVGGKEEKKEEEKKEEEKKEEEKKEEQQ